MPLGLSEKEDPKSFESVIAEKYLNQHRGKLSVQLTELTDQLRHFWVWN